MRLNIKKAIVASMGLMTLLSLASCGDKKNEPLDQNKVYDSVTSKLELKTSAEGKDFFTDGIQEATLTKATDGDTATFKTSTDKSVTIRFYGIDTPESTGSVEKWGKSASNFTKEILTKAYSIILEASEAPAVKDSYGDRYLGYVWVKSDAESPYKNVNLQVVENGFSADKSKPSDKYASYFKEAEEFARKGLLHIWNENLEDPNYSDKAIETDLKDIVTNPDTYYDKEESLGVKVRVTVYLKSYRESSSGTVTFVAGQVVDGKEYTYNIYAGYNTSNVPGNLYLGTLYTLTGTVQMYNGQYQISGLTYVPMKSGGDLVTEVQSNYYLQFDNGKTYEAKYYQSLYGNITVTEASVSGTTLTFTGSANNKKTNETKTFTFTCPVSEGYNVSDIQGKTISTYGCVDNNVVTILDYTNISIK